MNSVFSSIPERKSCFNQTSRFGHRGIAEVAWIIDFLKQSGLINDPDRSEAAVNRVKPEPVNFGHEAGDQIGGWIDLWLCTLIFSIRWIIRKNDCVIFEQSLS